MQLQLQCDVVQHGLAYLLAASCTVDKRERERESRRERQAERAPDLDLSVARLIEPLVRFYCHNKSIFTVQQFVALPENNLQQLLPAALSVATCNARAVGCSLRWRLARQAPQTRKFATASSSGEGASREVGVAVSMIS